MKKLSLAAWVLFWVVLIGLMITLWMRVHSSGNYQVIDFSSFEVFLSHNNVKTFTIDGDDIFGDFTAPQSIPDVPVKVLHFRTSYPEGTFTNPNSGYLKMIMKMKGSAQVKPKPGFSFLHIFGQ